jgi:hypothetical protein
MAEIKTQRTKASVAAFLAAIPDAQRQRDAKAISALIRKATGEKPAMWGTSIVGYGQMVYTSSGRSVEWFPIGFSPRKAALVLYLMGGLKKHAKVVAGLGKHKISGGCLHLRSLDGVDTKALTRLVQLTYKGNLARDSRGA